MGGALDVVDDVAGALPGAVAADAGAAVGEAVAGALPNIGLVVAGVTTALAIGTAIASDMPDDQKAVSATLDVANAALAFIPVVGWALAIVGSMLKPVIMGLWHHGLTHEQRERIEAADAITESLGILTGVTHAFTPSDLYDAISRYGSQYTCGVSGTAVSVFGGYLTAAQADAYAAQGFIMIPGNLRAADYARQAGYGDDLEHIPVANGCPNPTYPVWTPRGFMEKWGTGPDGFWVNIQAGVTPDKLARANALIHDVIARRLGYLRAARNGDAFAVKVLVHTWKLFFDAFDPSPWITQRMRDEMPVMVETLMSLYYQDIARTYEFEHWQDLVGHILQSRWSAYLATTPAHPSWDDFQQRVLGYRDLRALRADVFAGRFGVGGQENEAMFAHLAHEIDSMKRMLAELSKGRQTTRFNATTGQVETFHVISDFPALVNTHWHPSFGLYPSGVWVDEAGAVAEFVYITESPAGAWEPFQFQ